MAFRQHLAFHRRHCRGTVKCTAEIKRRHAQRIDRENITMYEFVVPSWTRPVIAEPLALHLLVGRHEHREGVEPAYPDLGWRLRFAVRHATFRFSAFRQRRDVCWNIDQDPVEYR